MKYLLAITILVAMLVQTFSKAFIMADFYVHQQQIIEQLCENKDKPQLECDGHCQLKKELEKESKRDVPQLLKEIPPFIASSAFNLSPVFEPLESTHLIPADDLRKFGYSGSVFHPPAIL